MSGKEHYSYLDTAKGIAILLVVLGHSFPSNIFNGNDLVDEIAKVIYDFVYTFHMPVFFYISGFLFYKSWNTQRVGTLKLKAKRLLVPYLMFSIIYIPLRIFFSSMANSDYGNSYWKIIFGVSPNGGVWYLYLLFLSFVVTFFFVKKDNIKIFITVFAITSGIIIIVGKVVDYSVINYFMKNYVFFLYGLYCFEKMKTTDYEKKRINTTGKIIKPIFFLGLFAVYEIFQIKILALALAFIGIDMTLALAQLLKDNKLLKRIGVKSMDIYLLHGPIMIVIRQLCIVFNMQKPVIVFCLFWGSLVISIVIGKYVLRRNTYLSKAFLGIY